MWGHGGDLGDHDAAEGVGEGDVAVVESEFDDVGGGLEDLDREFLHWVLIGELNIYL